MIVFTFVMCKLWSVFIEQHVNDGDGCGLVMVAVGNLLLMVLRIIFELACCHYREEKYAH